MIYMSLIYLSPGRDDEQSVIQIASREFKDYTVGLKWLSEIKAAFQLDEEDCRGVRSTLFAAKNMYVGTEHHMRKDGKVSPFVIEVEGEEDAGEGRVFIYQRQAFDGTLLHMELFSKRPRLKKMDLTRGRHSLWVANVDGGDSRRLEHMTVTGETL